VERLESITDRPGVIDGGNKGVSSLAVILWRDFIRIAENEDHRGVFMVSKSSRPQERKV
jgi:hypothetical protein